ncbi:MAG: class I SAM-dependent methyltransferase [Dehalococcoidia bacterium]
MPQKFDPERVKELLSNERHQELDPFKVMAFIPIEPYQQVADIGCGPGFFTLPLAKYLISGKLYALDRDPKMLEILQQRVQESFLGNVEMLKSQETRFPVEKGSLDGVLLGCVVHEVKQRLPFLKAAGALLMPKGWCAVVEWLKKETDTGPPAGERISPEEMGELAKEAGLEVREWRYLSEKYYLMLLRK